MVGDPDAGISRKFVGSPSLVERALVPLATNRGQMPVGEPGTAKSLLSELIAAAVSGTSTLTVQGGAATTEDQIKYSWNYAPLVFEGPCRRSLVPAPMLRGMAEGRIVRFEEITRCPLEVQDCLLSERVVAVPELDGDDGMVFARRASTSSPPPTPPPRTAPRASPACAASSNSRPACAEAHSGRPSTRPGTCWTNGE
ncbi:AAA family ATPase [Kitasatospora cinereorecta]